MHIAFPLDWYTETVALALLVLHRALWFSRWLTALCAYAQHTVFKSSELKFQGVLVLCCYKTNISCVTYENVSSHSFSLLNHCIAVKAWSKQTKLAPRVDTNTLTPSTTNDTMISYHISTQFEFTFDITCSFSGRFTYNYPKTPLPFYRRVFKGYKLHSFMNFSHPNFFNAEISLQVTCNCPS